MPLVCCSVCCLLSFVGVYYTLLSRDKGCSGGSTQCSTVLGQCSDSAQNSARKSKTWKIPAIRAVAMQNDRNLEF